MSHGNSWPQKGRIRTNYLFTMAVWETMPWKESRGKSSETEIFTLFLISHAMKIIHFSLRCPSLPIIEWRPINPHLGGKSSPGWPSPTDSDVNRNVSPSSIASPSTAPENWLFILGMMVICCRSENGRSLKFTGWHGVVGVGNVYRSWVDVKSGVKWRRWKRSCEGYTSCQPLTRHRWRVAGAICLAFINIIWY